MTTILTLTGCAGGGGGRGNADEAAAESLTNALKFNNAGAKRVEGPFPGRTDEATEGSTISLSPGAASALTTMAGDDVVATIVWMEGADAFWSLPSGGATRSDGSLSNSFTVSDDVCDDLCNIIHQVKCYEAAQTADGTITQANLTTVQLQCEAKGVEAKCSSSVSVSPPTTGTDAGGSGDTTEPGPLTQPQKNYCDSICAGLAACPEIFDGAPSPSECQSECAVEAPQVSAGCLTAISGFMQCIANGGASTCESTVPNCVQQHQPAMSAAGCAPPQG